MVYYPNVMVEWYPHVLVVSTLIPRAVDRTTNVVEFYYPEEIALFEREFVEAEQAAYLETAHEDDEIALRIDAGRAALYRQGRSDEGPYQSPMEDGMQHFHEFLRRELDVERARAETGRVHDAHLHRDPRRASRIRRSSFSTSGTISGNRIPGRGGVPPRASARGAIRAPRPRPLRAEDGHERPSSAPETRCRRGGLRPARHRRDEAGRRLRSGGLARTRRVVDAALAWS
jgi:hypothetical protein